MVSDKQKIIVVAFLAIAFLFYSFYLYASLPVKENVFNEDINNGKTAWQQYNCNSCHQVYGLGGYLGPDLTNVYSTRGPDYINAFLTTGTISMPDFHLSEKEKKSIIAYLKSINASGNSDPRTFTIKYNGTIEQ